MRGEFVLTKSIRFVKDTQAGSIRIYLLPFGMFNMLTLPWCLHQ